MVCLTFYPFPYKSHFITLVIIVFKCKIKSIQKICHETFDLKEKKCMGKETEKSSRSSYELEKKKRNKERY